MTKTVIGEDVAEQEFQRFVDMMDLDIDPKEWDDEDKKSFTDCKRKIIDAMLDGRLVIDDKGQPVFTPSGENAQVLTFYEPTGATLMATDGRKKGHDVAKSFSYMGSVTRTSAVVFANMANRDLKVCQSIILLFLA